VSDVSDVSDVSSAGARKFWSKISCV